MKKALPAFSKLLQKGIQDGHHLGAQVYVSLRGDTVAELALGESREGVKMTRQTLMPWLSASKPIAAIAIAQQWEKGFLKLDDPVIAYIPEFEEGGKENVTIRHVLTHTGGFRSLIDVEKHIEISWDDVIGKICHARLEKGWDPGHRAGYQPLSGWYVLAEIVRRLTGETFEAYVKRHIFEPLDMFDSRFALSSGDVERYGMRLALLYDTLNGRRESPYGWYLNTNADQCVPGASGRGPMSDLGKFYQALLTVMAGYEGGVIRSETANILVGRHRIGLLDETFGTVMDWGLGFVVDSKRNRWETIPYGYGKHCSSQTFGHSGSQSSVGYADPKCGLAVAIAVNGLPGEKTHQTRFRSLTTVLYEELRLN